MLLSPTTKNRIQGREWGRGADSEKIWGEGRRIIWGEGDEERGVRTKEERLME